MLKYQYIQLLSNEGVRRSSEALICKRDIPNVGIVFQMQEAYTVIRGLQSGRSTSNTKQGNAMNRQRPEIIAISCIIHGPFVISCSKLGKNKILHISACSNKYKVEDFLRLTCTTLNMQAEISSDTMVPLNDSTR